MRVALLSGGVGGARLARGLVGLPEVELTVVVNVADDAEFYGLHVSPDLDTVLYTLAGREGPDGWGVADDTFVVMDELAALGEDTRFRLGDRDLATNLLRTLRLREGAPLSAVTAELTRARGIPCAVIPVSDDPVRTQVLVEGGEWLEFQEYFVLRGHADEVRDVRFEGASKAEPAPGVLEALEVADLVVIGPSDPPLSIWPVLAVPGVTEAVEAAPRVIGVSPLFGGRALKGPAHRVLEGLGLPGGNAGVVDAYGGLLGDLVIDGGDAGDRADLEGMGVRVHAADTRIADPETAEAFARWLVRLP